MKRNRFRAFLFSGALTATFLFLATSPSKAVDTQRSCQYSGSSPVPCSTVAFTQQANVSVTTSDTPIVATGNNAVIILCNTGASGNVWLNLSGGTAVVGSGVPLPAGNQCMTIGPTSTGVHGIADAVTSSVAVTTGN